MHNFVWHNPTKVLFGRDTLPKIGAETAVWGKKVLLVSGQASLKRSGLHEQITHSLREAGLDIIEHDAVRSNPLLSHAREGVAKAKTHQIEVIVAAGGGSVLRRGVESATFPDSMEWPVVPRNRQQPSIGCSRSL